MFTFTVSVLLSCIKQKNANSHFTKREVCEFYIFYKVLWTIRPDSINKYNFFFFQILGTKNLNKMSKTVLNALFFSIIFWSVIAFDISSNGSLESSTVGRMLQYAGLLVYVKPYYLIVEEKAVSFYRWSEKKFPHEEFDLAKNETIKLLEYIRVNVVQLYTKVFAEGKVLYNRIIASLPPDLTDKILKFLADTGNVIVNYSKRILNYLMSAFQDVKKWVIENILRDKITWEKVEKSYFSIAQKAGIYYSNVKTWVGRKIECLLTA